MSFRFNGTFNRSQYERFKAYVRAQIQTIEARIQHLQAEKLRVGNLAFAYDQGGAPVAFTHDPPSTYCGKLFAAYEALGGDPEFDIQVRSKTQAVFLLQGSYSKAPEMMSNGEVVGVRGLSDAQSAVLVQKARRFVSEDLDRRRHSLERKIMRCIDYAEQLENEISELTALRGAAEDVGSLEGYLKELDGLMQDPSYMAITDDSGEDPHGKLTRAPVAGYTPGPKGAGSQSYQRTVDGLVKPDK